MTTPTENVVAELRRAVMNGEDGCGTLPAKESVKVRPQDWHRITRLAREAAALIESQRATIERVERERDRLTIERDGAGRAYVEQMLAREAAEARVTALEAEKAGLAQELAETRSALKPFADFCEQAERFVSARAADGRTAIFPTKHFRLEHFRQAKALSRSTEKNDE